METSGISAITLDDSKEEFYESHEDLSSTEESFNTTESLSEKEEISMSIISSKTVDQTDVSMKSLKDLEPQDVSMKSAHDSICELMKDNLKLNTSDGSMMSLEISHLSEKKITDSAKSGSNFKTSQLIKPIIHKAKMCLLKKF